MLYSQLHCQKGLNVIIFSYTPSPPPTGVQQASRPIGVENSTCDMQHFRNAIRSFASKLHGKSVTLPRADAPRCLFRGARVGGRVEVVVGNAKAGWRRMRVVSAPGPLLLRSLERQIASSVTLCKVKSARPGRALLPPPHLARRRCPQHTGNLHFPAVKRRGPNSKGLRTFS